MSIVFGLPTIKLSVSVMFTAIFNIDLNMKGPTVIQPKFSFNIYIIIFPTVFFLIILKEYLQIYQTKKEQIILGTVHRSHGIYLTVEENPRKPKKTSARRLSE